MGGKYLTLSATGVVLGLTGSICVCVAFFTNNWLEVLALETTDDVELEETNYRESKESPNPGMYGLWYIGQGNDGSSMTKSFLNCDAIPFSVCMYTRAGLFSAVVLMVPAMLLALLSAAVLASHGQIHTTGTLARASSTMFILATFGSTSGMLAFTLQQTVCLSTCPPEHEYFPLVRDGEASLGWSFYVGWIGSGLLLMAASALLALSCEAASQVRLSKSAMNLVLNNPLSRPNLGASQALSQHSGKV